MLGEIIKGGAADMERIEKDSPVGWPCWGMDVGDLWVVPPSMKKNNVQTKVNTYPRNLKRFAGMKFKTRDIDGVLHVWRVA